MQDVLSYFAVIQDNYMSTVVKKDYIESHECNYRLCL